VQSAHQWQKRPTVPSPKEPTIDRLLLTSGRGAAVVVALLGRLLTSLVPSARDLRVTV